MGFFTGKNNLCTFLSMDDVFKLYLTLHTENKKNL